MDAIIPSSGKREREREKSNNYSERLYIFPEAAAKAALDFLANHSLSLSSLRRFFSAYQDNRMCSVADWQAGRQIQTHECLKI